MQSENKTYGTITWFRGSWVIKAEPHVAILLRRTMPRIARRADFIGVADTLETSRQLEWFMSRYPLSFVDNGDREKPLNKVTCEGRLAERASKHRDGESLVDKLLRGVQPAMNFRLAIPARDYQKLGGTLWLSTGGILIAYDLGTGKTATAICGLTDPRARPALVVTLTHLPGQWESEIRKFAPRLTTHILQGTRPYDITKRCGGKFPEVVLCSYSKLDGWAPTLAPVIKGLWYDEIQELRNGADTNKGKAAALLSSKATYRGGLSATPIFNMGGEIHSIIEMVRPGSLGTKTEFAKEWCTGDEEKPGKLKIKDPKAMGTYLSDSGLMIRKTRQDIGREIPKLTRIPHEIDCDQDALKKIEGKAIELAKIIMSKTAGARGETFQASQELNNLVRQATGVSKAPYVAEYVRMLTDSGERVVVYAWHREVYAILMEQLSDKRKDGGDLQPVMYTGSESTKQKQDAKDRFCGGDSRVMLMSLRSGAGLDGLQHHCRIGAFAELDWSPMVHLQDEGRIARDGQPDPTLFYYLLSTSGSDPIISDILGLKRAQAEGILDPKGAVEHGLDADGQNVRKLAQAYLLKRAQVTPNGLRIVK